MNSIKNRLSKFFYGRYGIDKLGYFLMFVYAVLCVINAVSGSKLCQLITWAVLFYMFWRIMSRNHYKRLAENRKFLSVYNIAKTELKLALDRIKYHKTNRFRKCPHCKAIIKLPNKRGDHSVRCPKCSKRFDVKIR